MMDFKKLIIILPIILILMSCQNRNKDILKSDKEDTRIKIDSTSINIEFELILSFSKTPCHGNCPVYTFEVYNDGSSKYLGKANTNLIGTYGGERDLEMVEKLLKKADEIGFFSLSDNYPENGKNISDLPNTITFMKKGVAEKTIINNSLSPNELKDFENYIISLIDQIKWIDIKR